MNKKCKFHLTACKCKIKKRYIIGIGYPWYHNAFALKYQINLKTILPMQITSHGLATIQLYDNPFTGRQGSKPCKNLMLDPKGTHNGKKYKLVLEEI